MNTRSYFAEYFVPYRPEPNSISTAGPAQPPLACSASGSTGRATWWRMIMFLAFATLTSVSALAQGPLTNGWVNPGAISAVGETDIWTIAATNGDRMSVQIAKLSGGAGFTPRIQILAPNGASLGVKSGGVAARLDVQAYVSGTYTVAVSDANGAGAGSYGLQLAHVPGAFSVPSGDQGGSLTNGAIHQGTIDLGDSMDLWSVSANAGDRITLQIAKSAGGAAFTPMIELIAPDGARLGVASGGTVARLDRQAGASGIYTVLVSDANQSANQISPGTYQLQLAHEPDSFVVPAGDQGGVLADGIDTNGEIVSGDLDQWSFNSSRGDLITLQITEQTGGANFTPMIELFTPNGERKAVAQNASAATFNVAIESGGTYTVLVSDANQTGAGTYRLHLTRGTIAPPGANVLTNGATFQGSISPAGTTNFWTFTASAGESIVVRAGETTSGSTLTPHLQLYGPNGVLLDSVSSAAAAEVTTRATNSGTFAVYVRDNSAGQLGTGNYRISLAKTGSAPVISASDEGGPMVNGTTYVATIDTGDIDAWMFTANAGESIVVRMGEVTSSTLTPSLRLYGPDGVLLDSITSGSFVAAAEVTVRATNSGTFLVVASDYSSGWAGTGNYRISLAKTGSAPVISASDEGGPMVNGTTYLGTIDTGDVDAWTFTANAGESIVVRMGEVTSSTLTHSLRLYGPDGVLLDSITSGAFVAAAEVSTRATNSGTFLVVASDYSSGWTGTGNYRISLAKTGSAPVISASDEGGPIVNGTTYLATIDTGDIDAWTFTATAGENIVVRMGEVTSSTLTPSLRLYGPDGVLLDLITSGSFVAAAEVTARATNSGTFLVVASDYSSGWAGTGNYRISLAKTGGAPVISASDEGGPMVNGTTYVATIDTGDIDAWTFTANAGESIVVRMGETTAGSTLTPSLRLYGPDGVLLDSITSGAFVAAAEVTTKATNSGTFLVVASDYSSGWTGTGNYRLALAKTGEPVVISPNDEGGPMTGTGTYDGTIETGDIDSWTFTVCAGDIISINVTELVGGSTLTPWLRLYGRDGVLLKNLSGAATVQFTNFPAPASGTYTVVVSDLSGGWAGTGTYRLTVNGLTDGLKLCPPMIVGPNISLTGIGGVSGATYILLTTTNVPTPLNLWTPILTNQFDQFGSMEVDNVRDPAESQRFFILKRP
jgi:hypothetical protein